MRGTKVILFYLAAVSAVPMRRKPVEISRTFRMSDKLVDLYNEMLSEYNEVDSSNDVDVTSEVDFEINNGVAVDEGLPMSARIVGGRDAPAHAHPHQISLQAFDRFEGSWTHYCGGSIIANNKVITAAHCVRGYDKNLLRIVAGDHDIFELEGSEQTSFISAVTIHPNYDENTFDYDYALLSLADPLTLNDKVSVIDLAPEGFVPSLSCVNTGWGSSGREDDEPAVLQLVTLPFVDAQSCSSTYAAYNDITSRMLCAGGNDGEGICAGDSGGPLVCDGVLAGLTSWGPVPCGQSPYPGVFADVGAVRSWIDRNLK